MVFIDGARGVVIKGILIRDVSRDMGNGDRIINIILISMKGIMRVIRNMGKGRLSGKVGMFILESIRWMKEKVTAKWTGSMDQPTKANGEKESNTVSA